LCVPPKGENLMRSFLASIVLLAMAGALLDLRSVAQERSAPMPLEFEKRILDGSEIGWLFPTFSDFDGDGKIDLLVGVQGDKKQAKPGTEGHLTEGHLLVYLNRGTNTEPVYARPYRLDDVLPSGRIPGS
jgi:hypothetical protein